MATDDTAGHITLAGTDPEGDSLTFPHDTTSANGGSITGVGASVTYTPAGNFCGADHFDFMVDDGNGGTDTGTVAVSVACANEAPGTHLDSPVPYFRTTPTLTHDSPPPSVPPLSAVTDFYQ